MGQYAHLVSTRARYPCPSDFLSNTSTKLANAQVPNSEGEEDPSDPDIFPSRYPSRDADTHRGHGIRRPSRPNKVQEEAYYRRPQASLEASVQYTRQ